MKKEIKILHVQNKICAVLPTKRCFSYAMAEPENFVDFIQGLREDFPKFKLRCVKDEDLQKQIERRIIAQQLFMKGKQNG